MRTFLSLQILLSFVSGVATATDEGTGTSEDLERMFKRMENDARLFAKEMEQFLLPTNKCSEQLNELCSEGNYDACSSELPKAMCPGYEYVIPQCGGGQEGGCSGLYDFTASTVSLAPDKDRMFPGSLSEKEKDSICSSLPADNYMIGAYETSKTYWETRYKVLPPQMYYGNDDGMFRFYPGVLQDCPYGESEYDPRVRPWYVAASSGPKDIILVLDTSGSMENADRMSIMKDAAKRVVNTLGVSDYFSVIEFNGSANTISNNVNLLQRATADNKANAIANIDKLKPKGATNFFSGFDLAFKTFSDSETDELSSGCNKAILFLTDGEMGDNKDVLFQLLDNKAADYTDNGKSAPAIFTYSFGSGADSVVPKEIACRYDGVWSEVKDGGDLAQSMGAYYKYFANAGGMSEDDFVAWVAPYEYSTTGELGTTASAPVYDRSVNPPILAGVVGLDFSFVAMERALGNEGEASKNAIVDKIVKRSVAVCPGLNYTEDVCQLESLREYGSGEQRIEARCDQLNCVETQPLQSPLCDKASFPDYLPVEDVWDNQLNADRTYEEKMCCSVGAEPRVAGQYDEIKNSICSEKSNVVLVVALSVTGTVIVLSGALYMLRLRRKKTVQKESSRFPIKINEFEQVIPNPPPNAPHIDP